LLGIALLLLGGSPLALGARELGAVDHATVWADIAVDANGRVTDVTLIGNVAKSVLAEHLTTLIRSWEFKPAKRDGVAVPASSGLAIQLLLTQREHGTEVTVHGATTSPRLKNLVTPHYPMSALTSHREGMVKVEFRVTTEGRTVDVTSPELATNAVLARAAIDAVKQWTFVPERVDGQAVTTKATAPIAFRVGSPPKHNGGFDSDAPHDAPPPPEQLVAAESALEFKTPVTDTAL
jgi:TonB family protein